MKLKPCWHSSYVYKIKITWSLRSINILTLKNILKIRFSTSVYSVYTKSKLVWVSKDFPSTKEKRSPIYFKKIDMAFFGLFSFSEISILWFDFFILLILRHIKCISSAHVQITFTYIWYYNLL